jgi:hypothetical protein
MKEPKFRHEISIKTAKRFFRNQIPKIPSNPLFGKGGNYAESLIKSPFLKGDSGGF